MTNLKEILRILIQKMLYSKMFLPYSKMFLPHSKMFLSYSKISFQYGKYIIQYQNINFYKPFKSF